MLKVGDSSIKNDHTTPEERDAASKVKHKVPKSKRRDPIKRKDQHKV